MNSFAVSERLVLPRASRSSFIACARQIIMAMKPT